MANIYLYKFNNYYNRQIKRLEELTPSAIEELGGELVYSKDAISFKWLDGVSNELILNYDIETAFSGDYCLVEDAEKGNSVWFIMEATRTRTGQCRLSLYRDLINTYYEDIIKSPMFIEKATLSKDNDLIFNSENMSFNQIKTKEYLLHDSSTQAWIVGYLATNTQTKTNCSFTTAYDNVATIGTDHEEWEYAYSYESPLLVLDNDSWHSSFLTRYKRGNSDYPYQRWAITNYNTTMTSEVTGVSGISYMDFNKTAPDPDTINSWFNKADLKSKLLTVAGLSNDGTSLLQILRAYNGNRIRFNDGDYIVHLKLRTKTINYSASTLLDNEPTTESLKTYMLSVFQSNGIGEHRGLGELRRSPFGYDIKVKQYYIDFEPVSNPNTYTYSIPATVRRCNDAEYKIFGIPYTSCLKVNTYHKDGHIIQVDKNIALSWAMSIAKEMGPSLYDLQILPFTFIVSEDITGRYSTETGEGYISDNGYGIEGIDYIYLTDGNNSKAGICYFAKNSTFTRSIIRIKPDDAFYLNSNSIEVNNLSDTEFKVANECDIYRLCSPNYTSVFEIKATQNNGLKNFQAKCTYKPYTPFIYIYPEFERLYGKDYTDNRGLVLSGDFSLPIVKDEWTGYQIQNKYYQEIFDRQIQNMNVNNAIANQNAIAQISAGTVQGVVGGATSGALAGGGVAGAIVGGVVGGGASLGGGIADISNQKKLQAETLDYTKDLYGYQLKNIKALPNTLTKVGSLVATNKLWPFIEYYTCTDKEKEALRNKLKYNGMSVGVIDTMSNYIHNIPTYIKGKIIRIENTDIDFHEANIIAEELNKGVFI